MIHNGVVVLRSQQTCRKDHRVKWNIVLGHELKQLHLDNAGSLSVRDASFSAYFIRLFPPQFPIIGIVCRDGDVPNGGIEPDIEYLVEKQRLIFFSRKRDEWTFTLSV